MMARSLRSAPRASLLALLGCGVDPDRLGGPEVLLPDQVPVVWDAAYNGIGDGLGALVPVDVMAYDGATGRPLAGLEVHVWTADAAAMPIEVERVTVRDEPQDTGTMPYTAHRVASAYELGPYADPIFAEIEFWDAMHDQFVAVTPTDDVDLFTDLGGVARLYLFVDSFREETGGTLAPIQVIAAVGDAETVFSLVPR